MGILKVASFSVNFFVCRNSSKREKKCPALSDLLLQYVPECGFFLTRGLFSAKINRQDEEVNSSPDSRVLSAVEGPVIWRLTQTRKLREIMAEVNDILELYKQDLHKAKKSRDKRKISSAYKRIASTYAEKKQWEKALEYYVRSIDLDEQLNDQEGISKTYACIGNLFYAQQEWEKALMFYSKELEIEELRVNKKGIARAYNNIGTVYAKYGKIDKALESFHRSLDMKDEIGDIKGKVSTYDNIALVFDMLREWKKAEEFYDLSYEIKARLNDVIGMADNLWRRAKLYQEQEKFHEALNLMEQTISLLERVNYPQLDHYRHAFNHLLRFLQTD